jgi:ATP-dependent Clp protease protease subunit
LFLSYKKGEAEMAASRKPVVIRFFSDIQENSINTLMQVVDSQLQQGVKEFVLLISSSGGTVFHGLSAYNYLKGVPATFVTHNFGSVDSVALVLYCAGKKRLSVPHARFLIHGVSAGIGQQRLEEKQIEEVLKSVKIDEENIAKVTAANAGKTANEVIEAMHERTTLNPEDAKTWGLVHEIKSELFETGSQVIPIISQKPAQVQMVPMPQPTPI